ncbi:hypothetical protein OXX80_013839, partial [Metschnikowia pulcherrima]
EFSKFLHLQGYEVSVENINASVSSDGESDESDFSEEGSGSEEGETDEESQTDSETDDSSEDSEGDD